MKQLSILTMTAFVALALSGCTGGASDAEIYGTATGGTLQNGIIKQAGSSTVLPIAEIWAEDFGLARGVQVQVAGGGSGAGASGLCAGELDIGDMSRLIKSSEVATCNSNGIDPIQWPVAYDGLSVVVGKSNNFVDDLTVEQLNHIFRGNDFAVKWSDVDPSFPSDDIRLCIPDGDSGTYEYFNEEIVHDEEPRLGSGVQQSPDDNVLVTCLNDKNAIGYFGYAYYIANAGKLNLVAVDGVKPNDSTVADGSYTPLSRAIYMATDGVPTGLLLDYFAYAFHPEGGQALVPETGYLPLPEDVRKDNLDMLGIEHDHE